MASKTAIVDKKKSAKPAKKKAPKKTRKKKDPKEDIPKKPEMEFKFKAKDGTLTSIPMIGKVNVIELRQEKRTDFLFTRLPKELALKYSPGTVRAKYDNTIGDCCVLATKYRGDAVDANRPRTVSECYTIIFCDHFAETSADLERISEGIADDDIRDSLFALDESKALVFRNKWIVEKTLRLGEQEKTEGEAWSRRKSATRMAAAIVDDVALGDRAVEEDVSLFSMGKVGQWVQKNWIIVLVIVLGILFIASMFRGG